MSIAELTKEAEEALALRRDIGSLQQALRAKQDTIDALQRRVERMEKVRRLMRTKSAQYALEMEQLDREV